MANARPTSAVAPAPRLSPKQRREQDALKAARFLAKTDPYLRDVIRRCGVRALRITRDPFQTLLGSIVQQQISMSAAAAIQQRIVDQLGGKTTPEATRALSIATLRKCGLSARKAEYVHDLADHFADGRLASRKLRRMSDESVIEAVTAVRGVGIWTAEMLLMFCLGRPDVWPVDDLGIQKAVRLALGGDDDAPLPTKSALREIGERWRPWRTYASWYMWRSLEGPLMPGVFLAPLDGEDGRPRTRRKRA